MFIQWSVYAYACVYVCVPFHFILFCFFFIIIIFSSCRFLGLEYPRFSSTACACMCGILEALLFIARGYIWNYCCNFNYLLYGLLILVVLPSIPNFPKDVSIVCIWVWVWVYLYDLCTTSWIHNLITHSYNNITNI